MSIVGKFKRSFGPESPSFASFAVTPVRGEVDPQAGVREDLVPENPLMDAGVDRDAWASVMGDRVAVRCGRGSDRVSVGRARSEDDAAAAVSERRAVGAKTDEICRHDVGGCHQRG